MIFLQTMMAKANMSKARKEEILAVLSCAAATVQIGHGNGSYGAPRSSGIIYRVKINFKKTTQGLP